jgi:hypothetical protein
MQFVEMSNSTLELMAWELDLSRFSRERRLLDIFNAGE